MNKLNPNPRSGYYLAEIPSILGIAGYAYVKDASFLTAMVLLPKPLTVKINNAPKSLQVFISAVRETENELMRNLSPKSLNTDEEVRGGTNL